MTELVQLKLLSVFYANDGSFTNLNYLKTACYDTFTNNTLLFYKNNVQFTVSPSLAL